MALRRVSGLTLSPSLSGAQAGADRQGSDPGHGCGGRAARAEADAAGVWPRAWPGL